MPQRKREIMVVCPFCNGEYDMNRIPGERRALEGGDYEVGITCPHCQIFLHSYFTSDQLEKMRLEVEQLREVAGTSEENWERYKQAQARFQAAFDEMNQRLEVIVL